MATTAEIVQYMINELAERGVRPLKTALVKFVYLADVEAIREGLPRLTNVEWIFYKYGPYSAELDNAIRQIAGRSIDELSGVSAAGKPYLTYHGPGHAEEFKLSPQQRGIINIVLNRWAGETLPSILNYAYFETEPMQDAKWGQPLDFGFIHRREVVQTLADYLSGRVDAGKIAQLSRLKKEFWARARSEETRLVEPSPRPRYDEVLAQGLRVTDGTPK